MITVIKTSEGFDNLESRWNELFNLSSSATPYQNFLFNRITWDVWHETDDTLYLICFSQSEGAKIDAIIPCYLNSKRELHLIDYLSDFCDGIIPDELVEKYAMYKEISNHILGDSNIKSVCFNNLRATNRMLSYLYAFGGNSSVKVLTGYSVIRMKPSEKNKDFIDSIQSCNSSQRKKLRKLFKGISDLDFKQYNYPTVFPEQDLKSLADYMIETRMRSPEYFDNRFFEYFHRLYDAGLLTIFTQSRDSKTVAGKMFLPNSKAGEYISWITLYRGKQDNSSLILASLDKIYNSEIYNFNFARGVYAYKLSDFHPYIYTLNQLVIRKSRHEVLKANLKEAYIRETEYLKSKVIIRLSKIKHKLHI